jgi:geranylgeranylglycerol-phosphate geranylgeranyltransferase
VAALLDRALGSSDNDHRGGSSAATRPIVSVPVAHRRGRRTDFMAHLQTWRPYTLPYPGLVGLAGGVLRGERRVLPLAIAGLAVTLGWLGGHYLGDWFDRDLDAVAKPQRPIPSGRIRLGEALGAGIVCAVLFILLALLVRPVAAVAAVLVVIGTVVYSAFAKARGLIGNLVRGSLTGMAFAVGMLMAGSAKVSLVLVALALTLHDVASNLTGTLRDVEYDRTGGYETFPVRHGIRLAVIVALAFWTVSVVVNVVGLAMVFAGTGTYLLLAVVGTMGACAFWPIYVRAGNLNAADALRAHNVLVLERIVLTGALLSAGLGVSVSLVIVLPLAAASWLLQRRMRAAYEFGNLPPRGE